MIVKAELITITVDFIFLTYFFVRGYASAAFGLSLLFAHFWFDECVKKVHHHRACSDGKRNNMCDRRHKHSWHLTTHTPHTAREIGIQMSQSRGMFWKDVQGMSCLSHHLAYVVLDFLLILLNGAWKTIRRSRLGFNSLTALILRRSAGSQ